MGRLLLSVLLLCSPGFSAALYRVACGSSGGVDAAGAVWTSDAPYAAGGLSYNVVGAPDLPFSHLRYSQPGSPITYTFPAAPASYVITLRFIEPRATQTAGQRVFSVSINGAVALPALDLFAAAGAMAPKDYSFPVVATGALTITLAASVGNAVLSGIVIDGPPAPLPASYLPPGAEAAKPATCPGAGLTFYIASDTAKLFWCAGGPWSHIWDGASAPVTLLPVMGTLVGGKCQAYGTGFHLDGKPANAAYLANEPAGNCVLP